MNMNKHRILLTCFGSKIANDFIVDFEKRADVTLFVGDTNPRAPVSYCTPRFIPLRSGDDAGFCDDLLEKAKGNGIEMIIPGGDEDAVAIMRASEQFERTGIIAAVPQKEYLPVFRSKAAQYSYLTAKGFLVPQHEHARTAEEFDAALSRLDYPREPLIIKPNFGRGGRGITIVSETPIENGDNLTAMPRSIAARLFDGATEFLLMHYSEGVVYDIDVLRYKDGSLFFGARKRLGTNVTKLFSGNMFDASETILTFSRKVYDALPTDYLVDYDVMVGNDGTLQLLEVNPRPSGSTISYLPFGVNLYYTLVKSYLDSEHIPIDYKRLAGRSAHTFYKMKVDRPL